jgi:hypothetical protein
MEIPVVTIDGKSVIVRGAAGHGSEITIGNGEVYRVSARVSPVKIQCLGGVLWVTKEDDPQDYILQRCQSATFRGPGRIIVQSLPRGKMCITTVE